MNVLVSCVSENDERWFERVQNLVISVRSLGGSLAKAQVVVNFVGGVAPEFEERLLTYNAQVRVVDQYRPDNPFDNKLRMLELGAEEEFDVLLMLDCDVVVTGDVTSSLDPDRIGACLAWGNPLTESQWQYLLQKFGLDGTAPQLTHPITGSQVHPYFNTGVISVPRQLCSSLLREWDSALGTVAEAFEERPDIAAKKHPNQFAFCGAILSAQFPVTAFPLSMNFPTGRDETINLEDLQPPFVVHYRSNIDEQGFLRASDHETVDNFIDQFNRKRAEQLGLRYTGITRKRLARKLAKRSNTFRRLSVMALKAGRRLMAALGKKPRRISRM